MGLLTSFGSFTYNSTIKPNTTSDLILADNGRVVSLMGPAIKGKAFIPQGFNTYIKNAANPNGQSFEEKLGSLSNHYKKYQAKINSIFSAYTILNSNAQINYTKILGINIPGSDFNPGLKIGLDNKTNKLYAFGFYAKRKDTDDLNRYNFEILEDDDVKPFLAGFIVTSKNINLDYTDNYLETVDINGINKDMFKLVLTEDTQSNNFNDLPEPIPTDNDKVYINGQKPNLKIYFSFDKNDDFYWKKVLNTNIDRLDELGYTFINAYDIQDEYDNIIQLESDNEAIFLLELTDSNYLDFEKPFSNASSPWFVSQGYYEKNQSNKRIEELSLKDRVKKLFRFHSVMEGEYGNNYVISINPSSLGDNDVYAKFDIYIYDKIEKEVVQSFIDVNLNPNSQNYIRRMIGDKREIFDVNGSNRIITVGEYNLTNNYIWVEVTDEVERGLIPKETIPAGFIEKNKFKSITIDSNNNDTFYKKVYNPQPIINVTTPLTISDKHSWGHKLYKIKQSENISIDSFQSKSLNGNIESTKSNITIKLNKTYDIIEAIKTNNFLNDFYFDEINNQNMTNEDIFHLEKISLINEISNNNMIKVRTDLSSYINSGKKLYDLNNTKFTNEIFDNTSGIIEANFPFYYLTLNKSIDLNGDKNDICDIIDKKYFKFSIEMSGGWDGLNIFDIEQKAMTNKGIENNTYISDLYKYALDICLVHENGLNNIVYLSGIYSNEIIKHALNNIDNDFRFKQLFIYDLPLYDNNLNMIDYTDFLERKTGTNQKWSDHFYEYKQLVNINEKENLLNWINLNQNIENKFAASFANYSVLTFDNIEGFSKIDLIMPSGIWGLKLLLESQSTTSITNIQNRIVLNGVSIKNIFVRFNEQDPSWEIDLNVLMKKNKTNVLINRKSSDNVDVLGFNTSRTTSFIDNNNNQSLNSMMIYRLLMNEIKRVIEININRNMIFESIRSKKETMIKYQGMIDTVMREFVSSNLIIDYTLRIDDTTTSDEDLLNNILRGEIEIYFRGQNNIITNKQVSKSQRIAF